MAQNDLGALIRNRRTELKMPLRILRERTGLSDGYLSGIEHGRFDQPNAANLSRIAAALELNEAEVHYLAGYGSMTGEPELATYLRHRYDLPPEAANDVRRYVKEMQRKYGTTSQGDNGDEEDRATTTS